MSRKPFGFAVKPLASGTIAKQKKVKDAAVFVPKSSKKPFGAGSSNQNSSSSLGKRARHLSKNLFDDDDDEEEEIMEQPPKKALVKLSDGEDVNELVNTNDPEEQGNLPPVDTNEGDDPLDTFMSDMAKEPLPSNENKGTRGDIEDEDETDTFMIQREAELQNHPELFEDLEDYDSGAEGYLDSVRAEHIKQKKFIEPLPVVYHSEIDYTPFSKQFYCEHEEIKALAPSEVNQLRKDLDVRVTGDNVPKPVCSFAHLGLGERIGKAIEKQRFVKPTPIQCQAIPAILSGRDVIGIAKTGSGKTAAFVWPMLIHIKAQPPLRKGDGPIGLIIAPTRELAQQIFIETSKYAKRFKLRVCPIYGGVPKVEQVKELKRGVEILVCTPGRLIDVIKMKKITNMRRVTYVVFDEADKMFNMGFEIQVRSIAGQVRPDRQTLLFSATFKKTVENVARDILTDPVRISVGVVGEANADVNQRVHVVKDDSEKWGWLVARLPIFQKSGSVLIFVGTKNASEELSSNLNLSGFSTVALHGDKLQHERDEIMHQYKAQKIPILVATDVVGRGLDIKSIQTVVNFDVARDIDSHIHRIGRTCRAGSLDGVAYTLIGPKNATFAGLLLQNLQAAKQPVPPELIDLAMQDPRYVHRSNRGGRGRGSRGLSSRGRGGPQRSSGQRGRGLGFSPSSSRGGLGRIQFQPASKE